MDPGVTGRAELFEWFAISVNEMKRVRDMNRAVIFCGGFGDGELTGFAVEFRNAATGDVMPRARGWRHEANAVGSISIVEACRFGCCAVGVIESELG